MTIEVVSRLLRRILVLAASAAAGTAQAQTRTTPPTLVEEHAIGQLGLAVGLTQTVTLAEGLIMVQAFSDSSSCTKIVGGGSIKRISFQGTLAHNASVNIYYDDGCQDLYIEAIMKIDPNFSGFDVTQTALFFGTGGSKLGTLKVAMNVDGDFGDRSLQLAATGDFSPSGPGDPASVGFACTYPLQLNAVRALNCDGGIAQSFKKVQSDIASLAPVRLTLKKISGDKYRVSFSGSNGELASGKTGKLGISVPGDTTVKITGSHTSIGSAKIKGGMALFGIFPPTPTSWTVTDSGNDTKFSIAMTASTQDYEGKITKISDGSTLANFSIDKSGTGTITYSNNFAAKITSWLLTN